MPGVRRNPGRQPAPDSLHGMAGRATTGGRSSGSRAGATTRGTPRKPAARKPAARGTPAARTRRNPDLLDRAIDGVGRGVARAGRGMGRGIGRTREIDPVHRRDGLGVSGPRARRRPRPRECGGRGRAGRAALSSALAAMFGIGARWSRSCCPVVGLVLMTTEPHREGRPRLVVGSLLLRSARSAWCTSARAAGGARAGARAAAPSATSRRPPLATGLTVWVAVPVLLLLSCFALLVLTGTPLREVPDRLRRLSGRALDDEDDEHDPADDDLVDAAAPDEPAAEPAAPSAARRRQGSFVEPTPTRRTSGATRRARTRPTRRPPAAPPRAAGQPDPARPTPGRDAVGEQLRLAMREPAGDTTYVLPPQRPAAPGHRRRAPAATPTTRSSRRSPASSSSSTSTPPSPASPAARRSPATRSSSARRSRSRRSPR